MTREITPAEARQLYGVSYHGLMQRGDAFARCDRFTLTPSQAGELPWLSGYRGEDCLLGTVVL